MLYPYDKTLGRVHYHNSFNRVPSGPRVTRQVRDATGETFVRQTFSLTDVVSEARAARWARG